MTSRRAAARARDSGGCGARRGERIASARRRATTRARSRLTSPIKTKIHPRRCEFERGAPINRRARFRPSFEREQRDFSRAVFSRATTLSARIDAQGPLRDRRPRRAHHRARSEEGTAPKAEGERVRQRSPRG
eukprot:8493-Pelagococcus_subviridis.AAC.4